MELPAELAIDWRGICEQMFKRLMVWETDYREDSDRWCAKDLHDILGEHEEQWQRLSEWEMAHIEGQTLEEWKREQDARAQDCYERLHLGKPSEET